jgi:outer membrane lipoprotein-sorting protein
MRSVKLAKLTLAGVFAAGWLGAAAGSGWAAEFSADVTEQRGGETTGGRIYVKGDKIRREAVQKGEEGVMIVRMDKGVVWMVTPKEKKYVEMGGMAQGDMNSPEMQKQMEKLAEKKVLGTEKVHGYDCEKVQWVYREKGLGTMTQWTAKKLQHPIKTEHKDGSGKVTYYSEYRNIQEEKVPDSLFELPKGYEKMEMPGMGPGRGKARGRQ